VGSQVDTQVDTDVRAGTSVSLGLSLTLDRGFGQISFGQISAL
jgi:hypothetical protein